MAAGAAAASSGTSAEGPSHTAPNPPVPIPGASNRVAPDDGGATDVGPGAKQYHVLPMQVLFDRTVSLLKRRDFQSADPRSYTGLKKRLEMMREAGLPNMRLLPGKVLQELGRIPRSTDMREGGEPYTVDALEMIGREGFDSCGMPNSIIAFFSHRWLRANYSTMHKRNVEWGSAEWLDASLAEGHYVGMPDTEGGDKVRDLIEWMRWLKWRTSRPTKFMDNYLTQKCNDVYFFIDWPCVDQKNPVAEICALPAFVSSCSLIASYFTEEYRGRAWCQAELLVSRAFCALPVVMRVPLGFKHEEQLFLTAGQFTLPDPSDRETAMITNEDDRPTIAALTRKIAPGKSGIQLVEPCGARVPHSWSQAKLWFHLCPESAVGSLFGVVASLYFVFCSFFFMVELGYASAWNSYLPGSFMVLLSIGAIIFPVIFYPSIEQSMAVKTRQRLVKGLMVGGILSAVGLVVSAATL